MSDKTFEKILREMGYPPIFMVSLEQFERVEGVRLEKDYGISSTRYPIISVRRGLRGRVKANTLYHECFHLLFPHRPHWWIENAAEVMARGGGRGFWAKKYGHSVEEMPPRSYLLKLARRASRRLKRQL